MDPNVEYDYDYDYIRMTPGVRIPTAIGLCLLIVISITGNLITIYSFLTDRRLHTVYDGYIFNLAVADMLIGCISMPFYAVYTLEEFTWPFGRTFCKVWLCIDFTLCLESVLLILMLSYDRLMLVTLGPQYATKITKRGAAIRIVISWILAFLLYGPAIIGWDYWVGYSSIADNDCDVEFAYNSEFTTAAALVEFFLPVVSLAVLNFLLYRKIRERLSQRRKIVPTNEQPSYKCSVNVIPENSQVKKTHSHKEDNFNQTPTRIRFKDNNSGATDGVEDDSPSTVSRGTGWRMRISKRRDNKRISRDSKAARVLAILVVVFLVSWAPYTITTMIVSFCGDSCVNTSFYESMNWLLWGKSAINPFLYAVNSSRYRYNFKRVLLFWRKGNVVHHETNVETTCHTAAS